METALRVLARHALLVLVASVVRKRTTEIACSIELGPDHDPEVLNPRDVRQKARGLSDVDVVLALMSRHRLNSRAFA